MCSRLRIDLPNRRPLFFRIDPSLGGVAVRADADVELRAIRVRDEALRPVMIVRPTWEGSDRPRRSADAHLALAIRKCDERVGVRDVERAPNERDAERGMQTVEEVGASLGYAVAVRITK